MYSQLILSTILASYIFQVATSITIDENSKYLFNQNEERKLGHKKRRPQSNYNTNYNPCAFGPNGVKGIRGGHKKPKSEATGRTFFDVTKVDVDYNYHYQINCGGSPILAPVVKPIGDAIKPILADGESSGHKPSGQGLFANKPVLAGLFGDRPVQNLFGITQSQSQTQTQDPYQSRPPSGQYLVFSNPHFGSYVQDLSEFDFINPIKILQKFGDDLRDTIGEVFTL